jgi:hypothetical protein
MWISFKHTVFNWCTWDFSINGQWVSMDTKVPFKTRFFMIFLHDSSQGFQKTPDRTILKVQGRRADVRYSIYTIINNSTPIFWQSFVLYASDFPNYYISYVSGKKSGFIIIDIHHGSWFFENTIERCRTTELLARERLYFLPFPAGSCHSLLWWLY